MQFMEKVDRKQSNSENPLYGVNTATQGHDKYSILFQIVVMCVRVTYKETI